MFLLTIIKNKLVFLSIPALYLYNFNYVPKKFLSYLTQEFLRTDFPGDFFCVGTFQDEHWG